MYLKTAGWVANSEDPDQMPHSTLFAHACLSQYLEFLWYVQLYLFL